MYGNKDEVIRKTSEKKKTNFLEEKYDTTQNWNGYAMKMVSNVLSMQEN